MEKTVKKPTTRRTASRTRKPRVAVSKSDEPEKIEEKKVPELKAGKFFEAVGRRKTAIARVRIFAYNGTNYSFNGKTLDQYFPDHELQVIVRDALDRIDLAGKFSVTAVLKGGGLHAQAEATRHGVSRALLLFDPELRKRLKKSGFLTRDPRMRERKKFGLKRARRAPQWQKR